LVNYLCCQHIVQSATFLWQGVPSLVLAPQMQDEEGEEEDDELPE
jgi:hypothetical protein